MFLGDLGCDVTKYYNGYHFIVDSREMSLGLPFFIVLNLLNEQLSQYVLFMISILAHWFLCLQSHVRPDIENAALNKLILI